MFFEASKRFAIRVIGTCYQVNLASLAATLLPTLQTLATPNPHSISRRSLARNPP
jgi:hypothetical protein